MSRGGTFVGLVAALSFGAALCRSAEPLPTAEMADIRVSLKAPNMFLRNTPPRAGRYEVKNATMVDLIRIAWGFDADKILGGPSWLEMDRFDVIAKVPADATAESVKPLLQSLLEDRFKVVVHKDTRLLPMYALTAGKKPQLKEADGSGDTGCRAQTSAPPPPGGAPGGISMISMNGGTPIALGPGMMIQYSCRNMTMEALAAALRGNLLGAGGYFGNGAVQDRTGIKGAWNFDLRYSLQMGMVLASASERTTIFEAVDKQLGLKLEEQKVPTPVLVVDTVNQRPSPNPPGVAEALPALPVASEFEVADVKPSDPDTRMGGTQMQPGGRFSSKGMPMQFLLSRAFNTNSPDQIVGAPKWVDSERFDITAKAPASASNPDIFTVGPMLRSLLEDRFKLKTHTEERPLPAYSLVAGRPKMKKADPASRTHCIRGNAPAGAAPGTTVLTCQNITMAQFADQLQNTGPGLSWPVVDSTGIEGGWDFVLTWNQRGVMLMAGGGGRGGDAGPAGPEGPSASDPSGGYTIFEAVEKELGLKLEMQKRSLPVIVIDHIEQKPTDN